MIFLTFVGLWLVCGVATFVASVWLAPDKFDAELRAKKQSTHYPDIYLAGAQMDVLWRSVFTMMFWPGAIFYLTTNALLRVLLRSKREKLKIRDELEKDLAAARQEVEDLLRSARK